jgi:hypothetical protein
MKVLAIASITRLLSPEQRQQITRRWKLPLTAGGFAKYGLMHPGPLAPLGLLLQGK